MNYLQALAERIRGQVEPSLVPEDAGSLFLMYAVLALVKGTAVGGADVHDAWGAWMTMRGEGDHAAVRPFRQLPARVQAADDPFVQAIRAVAKDLDT